MSAKSVIIWVSLAVLLGGLTLFLVRTPTLGGGASANTSGLVSVGARLFDFNPSSVARIVVTHADGSIDTLTRSPGGPESPVGSDAEWFLLTQRPSTAGQSPVTTSPWPLTASSVQGLLRKLTECECIAPPAKDAELGDRPTIVEITLRDGSARTLRLADRTLAGAGLIEVQTTAAPGAPATTSSTPQTITSRAIINDELHRVFTNPGPRAWRERALFSGIIADAARIHLETPRQRLALGRTDGRWALHEPVAPPADPAAAQRLLASLARVEIDDFLDDGAPNLSTGLENPVARITIEADRRAIPASGEPKDVVATLEVVVGGAADTTGRRIFASINEERLVLLDARALAALSLDPATYLWPAPARLPSADIGAIILQPSEAASAPAAQSSAGVVMLKRSLARWVRIEPSGQERLLAGSELQDAQALALFLTGEDRPAPAPQGAPPVQPTGIPTMTIDAPDGYRPLVRIDLRSIADAPLETIEVGPATSVTLTFKTGSVYRTYPINRVPAVLTQLAAIPPRPAPEGPPEPEQPSK